MRLRAQLRSAGEGFARGCGGAEEAELPGEKQRVGGAEREEAAVGVRAAEGERRCRP